MRLSLNLSMACTSTIKGFMCKLTTIKSFLSLMKLKKSLWESTALPSKSISNIFWMLYSGVNSLTKLFLAKSLLIRCIYWKLSKLSSLLFEMSIVVMFFNRLDASSGIFFIKLDDKFRISMLRGKSHSSWILLLHKLILFRKFRLASSLTYS